MSRTTRRTKNTDKQTHIFKLRWGDQYLYNYWGELKYASLQDMYDEAVEERDDHVRKFYSDRYKWCKEMKWVKEFIHDRGARSKVHQELRRVFVSQDFDNVNFDREQRIIKHARWVL